MTDREIGFMKNIFLPNGTWRQFLDYMMMVKYFDEENPLPEKGIYIKEIGVQLGGELTVRLENGQIVDIEHSAVEADNVA